MKKLICQVLLFFIFQNAFSQESKPYRQIALERAQKIVERLDVGETKREKAKALIANQYIELSKAHGKRDDQLENSLEPEIVKKKSIKEIEVLHKKYISNLQKLLKDTEVEEVKNGMTYHTVPLTYANYLLMLPYLTDAQKDMILSNLKEAREHAMVAGTSKEKHAWFNKYKGRIANQLAMSGYDLKKEGNEWADRRNVKANTLEIKESNRIVEALNLSDKAKLESVRNLIAYQYQKLEELKRNYDQEVKENNRLEDRSKVNQQNEVAWKEYKSFVDKQRDVYFDKLAEFITQDQVELVKNEMTGNGLINEYSKFQQLLPNLKEDHKKQVYQYLLEARDNALNVLTSRERNQWFAKYRGRANNYLSKQGYDLRKATEELEKREIRN